MTAKGKRIIKGEIVIIKHNCKFCTGKKAFSKNNGLECTKCKKKQ